MTHSETLLRYIYARICALTGPQIMAQARLLPALTRAFARVGALVLAEARAASKAKMLAHAPWRLRVLKELGGERALMRWEKRRLRGLRRLEHRQIEEMREIFSPHVFKYTPPPSKPKFRGFGGRSVEPNTFYDRVKVDMNGHFCLTPISDFYDRRAQRSEPFENPYGLKVKYTQLNPIPVHPDELRGKTDARSERNEKSMAAIHEGVAKALSALDALPDITSACLAVPPKVKILSPP